MNRSEKSRELKNITKTKGIEKKAITVEELLEGSIHLDLAKETPKKKVLPLKKAELPHHLSTTLNFTETKIIDGLTPGATKNIICLNEEGIFIHAATKHQIRFVSFTKFNDELIKLRKLKKQLLITSVNNFIILISKRLSQAFSLEIDQKTGSVINQKSINVCEALRNSRPKNPIFYNSQKSSLMMFKNLRCHHTKPQFSFYQIKSHGIFPVLTLPLFKTTISEARTKFEEQKRSLQDPSFSSLDLSSPFGFEPSVFDFSCSKHDVKLIILKSDLLLILLTFDLKNKKVLFKRYLTIFDIMGKQRKKSEGEPELRMLNYGLFFEDDPETLFKNVYYFKNENLIAGSAIIDNKPTFFSTRISFSFWENSDVVNALPVESYQELNQISSFSYPQADSLFYISKELKKANHYHKLYSVDPLTLTQKEVFEYRRRHDFYPDSLKTHTYASLGDGSGRLLYTLPNSSVIFDKKLKKVVFKYRQRLEINLQNQFLTHFDDILAWSTGSRVEVIRLKEQQKSKNSQIELIKTIETRRYVDDFSIASFEPASLNLFILPNGNYLIFFCCKFQRENWIQKHGIDFIRIELKRDNLDIEFVEKCLFDQTLTTARMPVYYCSDSLIFCCFEGSADSVCTRRYGGVNNKCFDRKLILTSLSLKVLDKSKEVYKLSVCSEHPILSVGENSVISKRNKTSLLLHRVEVDGPDPLSKKLVLKRVLRLNGLQFTSNLLTKVSSYGFACLCGCENSAFVLRFNRDLELSRSFCLLNFRAPAQNLTLMNDGALAFENSNLGLDYSRRQRGADDDGELDRHASARYTFWLDFLDCEVDFSLKEDNIYNTNGVVSSYGLSYFIELTSDGFYLWERKSLNKDGLGLICSF